MKSLLCKFGQGSHTVKYYGTAKRPMLLYRVFKWIAAKFKSKPKTSIYAQLLNDPTHDEIMRDKCDDGERERGYFSRPEAEDESYYYDDRI